MATSVGLLVVTFPVLETAQLGFAGYVVGSISAEEAPPGRARSLSALQRLADNPPSDGRLQQAHADLVHAMATGLAGAGLALGVGLRGYAVVRRAAP